MKKKNDQEATELQDKLSDRQNTQVDLITMAIADCDTKPEIMIGIDNETEKPIFGFGVEAGDEDITIAFRVDDIEVAVDSDNEERSGFYKLKSEVEHLFIGDLINSIWLNSYEKLFDRMFNMKKEEE